MLYPLTEGIGPPELLVGRVQEFAKFDKWIRNIPKRLSKSRVILARRKSGKTAFVQRIFNQLWNENGVIVPFYFEVEETRMWLPRLAVQYYEAFASQYISFLERDPELVDKPMSLERIQEYALAKPHRLLAEDMARITNYWANKDTDLLWHWAAHAPHRFAAVLDIRFLVIIDEFQNLNRFVYRDEACERVQDDSVPGMFHHLSESKVAPMLVTGSYVSWLLKIMSQYLQAGRLSITGWSPYLTPDEGLEAVYQYAKEYDEFITNETAVLINQLCMADPYFIASVLQSDYPDKELTTAEGVVNTVTYEVTDRKAEMSKTWAEYIELTLHRINDRHAKSMLLYLNKHADRHWTPRELKEALHLDLELDDIKRKLMMLVESDMIGQGTSDIQFIGLQDGTLSLILRSRFEEEINQFVPDFKQDFTQQIKQLQTEKRKLQGMLNYISGKVAEHQLATELRTRKRFKLSEFFRVAGEDVTLNLVEVRERVIFQRQDGKTLEIDVWAESKGGQVLVVEVKKTQVKTGLQVVEDFWEKSQIYAAQQADKMVLPAILSLGGFTEEAQAFCQVHQISLAEQISWQLGE